MADKTPRQWCVPPSVDADDRMEIILSRVYDALVSEPVRAVATGIACANCDEFDRASAVLRRAQAVGFKADPSDCDRYAPVEYTLDHGGDCDDLTPLVMALAILSGIQAKVVYLSQPRSNQDHVTAKLFVNGEWQWAEASVRGARIGEHPYDAVRRTGRDGAFGGTGIPESITHGVLSNVLTVGLFAGITWMLVRLRLNPAHYNEAQARRALTSTGKPLPKGVTMDEFMRGMEHEREHWDVTHGDAAQTARIALAHLRERPDYYEALSKLDGR